MNPLTLSKLIFSVPGGWGELEREQPALLRLFAAFVLPLATLPPALLVLVGGSARGDELLPGLAQAPLATIAWVMFFAELATIPLMAGGIRVVSEVAGVKAGAREALVLAAMAPAPLWLSSLSLMTADGSLVIAAGLVAVAASASLVYRGLRDLLRVEDEVRAVMMAMQIYPAGVLLWVLLLAVFLLL